VLAKTAWAVERLFGLDLSPSKAPWRAYPEGVGAIYAADHADPARGDHPGPSGHPSLAGGELKRGFPLISTA